MIHMHSNASPSLTRAAVGHRAADGLDLRHGRATILRRAARRREALAWRADAADAMAGR